MKEKTLSTTMVMVMAATVVTTMMTGCAMLQNEKSQPVEFGYTATDKNAAGLASAFELNGSTVLQFVDLNAAQPRIYNLDDASQQTALPFKKIGQYAVMTGIHQALLVKSATGSASVIRNKVALSTIEQSPDTAVSMIDAASSASWIPIAQAVLDNPEARKKDADIFAIYAQTSSAQQQAVTPLAGENLHKSPDNIPAENHLKMDTVFASIKRMIPFNSGQSSFSVNGQQALAELLPVAAQAQNITVRGRTDSSGSSAANKKIALARAKAVRVAFLSGGVKARIKTTYCIHCFVESNDTEAGRSANRRVDVELEVPKSIVASLPAPVYSRVTEMAAPLVLAKAAKF